MIITIYDKINEFNGTFLKYFKSFFLKIKREFDAIEGKINKKIEAIIKPMTL